MLGVVGDLVEDVVVRFTGTYRYATDNSARISRGRGGSAANVAACAAPLVATRFLGAVGTDAAGDALVDALETAGVDVRVQRRGRTGTVVVLVDESGERTMFPDRAASTELHDPPADWLDGLRLLHVPAYGLGVEPAATSVSALVGVAHVRGIEVTMDASSTGLVADVGLDRFDALIDELRPAVLFANADEADMLDLDRPPYRGITTVVKHGAAPAIVRVAGRAQCDVPTSAAPAGCDTTGAGDAFAAGFLAARLHGADVTECARAGHRAALTLLDR